MKKSVLFFSSLAVASSALAVTPQVNMEVLNMVKSGKQPMVTTMSARTESATSKVVAEKSLAKVKSFVSKAPETRSESMQVSYSEPAGIFALGLSETLQGYGGFSYRKGPAYTPLTWVNTSVGATEYEWNYIDFNTGRDTIATSLDFVSNISYARTDAPVLYGLDEAGNSDVFQFGCPEIAFNDSAEYNVLYYMGGPCPLAQGQPNLGMTTYMYEQNDGGYASYGALVYGPKLEGNNPATGLDSIFTIPAPDGIGLKDPVFKGFANMFPAPAAPYFISKMWCWMGLHANKATTVEMTLYKIDEQGRITDEILAAGEADVEPTNDIATNVLSFDLYTVDEDGLQTEDLIVIDGAFLAVMTVNKEDFEQARSVWGGGALYPGGAKNPYARHAMIVLEDEGEDAFYYSPYSYFTDQTYSELMAVTDFMWMVDAVFPWTFAVNNENVVSVPVEGGTASFNVNSYYSLEDFNLYYDETADWIDLDQATLEVNQELKFEILNIPVAALPEGVDGRSTTITLVGPGTELDLTINQGAVNAVSVVVTDKNAEYFDLQGRKVANPEKGLYIKKSGNKAEKVIL